MKHHKPIRSILLLAILSCAGLLGCQWDSATYDSYVTAFGEGGIEGFVDCNNMEYIVINTPSANESEDIQTTINKTACCKPESLNTDCVLMDNALTEVSPYCIAFLFDKCPTIATRCLTEYITIEQEEDGTETSNTKHYCTNAMCQAGTTGCVIKYVDKANINHIYRTEFACLNPLSNSTCGAICSEDGSMTIEVNSEKDIENAKLGKSCANGLNCQETTTGYTCGCHKDEILCSDTCINPKSDSTCGISCSENSIIEGQNCDNGRHCVYMGENATPQYACMCSQNNPSPKPKETEYILDSNAAFCEIDGTRICINAQTSTTHCGAQNMCTEEDIGKQCAEHFRCSDGKCCNEADSNCNKMCLEGYRYCQASSNTKHDDSNALMGRNQNACLLNIPQIFDQNSDPYKSTLDLWKTLKFDNTGCVCETNYYNRDRNDANGCETAVSKTECGIINVDAVNCIDKYHAADDEDTKCVLENNQYKCQFKNCQKGYHLIYNQNNEPECRLYDRFCCGSNENKQCKDCTTSVDKDSVCIPDSNDVYECQTNTCNPSETNCNGICYTLDMLKHMHVTDKCECEEGYDLNINNNIIYCSPNPEKLCNLQAKEKNDFRYCFGQCLSKTDLINSNIDINSEDCSCIKDYQKIEYETFDNVKIGYCLPPQNSVQNKAYSCGKSLINCYTTLLNTETKDIKCIKDEPNHICTYKDCISGYCNWDGKPENGCESKLPNGFKDCNSCISNALLTTDNKKCIQRGIGWPNHLWERENLQYYCPDCQSGQFCCLNYSYGGYGVYGVCSNNLYCN